MLLDDGDKDVDRQRGLESRLDYILRCAEEGFDPNSSDLELRLAERQHYDNRDQPHGSLNGQTPIKMLHTKSEDTPFLDEVDATYNPGRAIPDCLRPDRLGDQAIRPSATLDCNTVKGYLRITHPTHLPCPPPNLFLPVTRRNNPK